MKKPLSWQIATVTKIKVETPRTKSFTLALADWMQHRAGQHYDVRLTAEDGYQAQRSYSIASEPERQGEVELTVERIADGEVSGYMHDVLIEGDKIEVLGPIGGYFVWETSVRDPLLLVAGGSGIVPLMSMIRHRRAARSDVPTRLLYSSRSFDEIIYRDELEALAAGEDGMAVFHTLTRSQPPDWKGFARRIDQTMLSEVAGPLGREAQAFVCGPTQLVEAVAELLVEMGLEGGNIRTERFGPTGG